MLEILAWDVFEQNQEKSTLNKHFVCYGLIYIYSYEWHKISNTCDYVLKLSLVESNGIMYFKSLQSNK